MDLLMTGDLHHEGKARSGGFTMDLDVVEKHAEMKGADGDLTVVAGTVDVTFVSATGTAACRTMPWGDLTIVDPSPARRDLDLDSRALLERTVTALEDRMSRWTTHLANHGVGTDDAHTYRAAAALSADRASSALQATQPDWLTDLLGIRPDRDPAATQVWEDAVRDVATARLRHGVCDPTAPMSHESWSDCVEAVATSRLWLDTHELVGAGTASVTSRSVPELRIRKHELNALFDTAPADVRPLIDQLTRGEGLPFDDLGEVLRDALVQRDARRDWIVHNWPYVVEAAEIATALDSLAADVTSILDQPVL